MNIFKYFIDYNQNSKTKQNLQIGFCTIYYYQDFYYNLSDYFLNSVYDYKYLDGFNLNEYIYKTNNNNIEIDNFAKLDLRLSQIFKFITISNDWTLLGHVCNLDTSMNFFIITAYICRILDFLFVVKEQPRENLFHICARYNLINFCKILLTLNGSVEALNNINKKGELPSYIAMKNRFDDIANLM